MLVTLKALMAATTHDMLGRDIERRVEALFGGHGSISHFARALGRHPSHLHRIFAGKRPVPEDVIAIVELLELIPGEQWPERWKRN